MIDLSEVVPKTILQHPKNKQIFLVIENNVLTIRRVKLYDVKNQKELQYEVLGEKPLTLDHDLNLIKQGFGTTTPASDFHCLDLDVVEKYILSPTDYQTLKFKLGELDNPRDYPDIIVKT